MKNYVKTFLNLESASQFVKTGLVAVVNTAVSFAIFNVGRVAGFSIFWSVTFGWVVSTALSYVLNRRWSFRLAGGGENAKESTWFVVVNFLAWGATVGLMEIIQSWLGPLSRIEENLALLFVSGLILLPKFATYRDLVFRRALDEEDQAPSSTPSGTTTSGH